jgi:hypothetical protein
MRVKAEDFISFFSLLDKQLDKNDELYGSVP